MSRSFLLLGALGVLLLTAAPQAGPPTFPLTVGSIMRGPELVGYPPSSMRWSGDSRELFFEWRQPGEDQAATWVVSREGAWRTLCAGGTHGGKAIHRAARGGSGRGGLR